MILPFNRLYSDYPTSTFDTTRKGVPFVAKSLVKIGSNFGLVNEIQFFPICCHKVCLFISVVIFFMVMASLVRSRYLLHLDTIVP